MSGAIPRELQYQTQDIDVRGQSQFIETHCIDPVAGANGRSAGQIRFMLPKTGLLDKDAFIEFQVVGPNNTSRLPLWTGSWSLFDNATLFCGGLAVQTVRGIALNQTLKNFYRTSHDRDNKQAVRMGQFCGLMVDRDAAGGYVPASQRGSGKWGIDINQDWAFATGLDDRDITSGYRLTNNPADWQDAAGVPPTPIFRMYISQIFPILYNNILPLGLIDDNFSIVLDLTPDLVRGQRSVPTAANAWVGYDPAGGTEGTQINTATSGLAVIKAPKLWCDLIFYDDDINQQTTFDRLREVLDKGQQLVFTDDQYVIRNQPVAGAPGTQVIDILLGLDHQIVRSMLIAQSPAIDYGDPQNNGNNIVGIYTSTGSRRVGGLNKGNNVQLSINSVPVYPNPIDTDGKIWGELSQVYPEPFRASSALTSFVGQVDGAGALVAAQNRITTKTLFGVGHPQSSLIGLCHYAGINLTKTYNNVVGAGTAISREPVNLTITDERVAGDLVPKLIQIWSKCERLMSIIGGKVKVSGS